MVSSNDAAEPGEYVGQSREVAGVETKGRLPQASEEEQAQGLIVASEEAMWKNLKSKSFSADNASGKLASGKAAGESLDASTPPRTLTPSLRPTLSYDGASFFLPIQEVKVLKSSLMPDAPLDLLTSIDTVRVEGLEAPGTLDDDLAPAVEEKMLPPALEEEAAAPVEEGSKTTPLVEETELPAAAEEEESTPVEVGAAASDEKSLAMEEKELPAVAVEEGSPPEENAPLYSETAPMAEEKDMLAPL